MNLREHRVTAAMFEELSAGLGGAAAVETLAAGQRSKHMLLVRGVVHAARQAGHPQSSDVRRAYDLLATIQSQHPEAAETVLRHPSTGAWARHTVRTLECPEQLATLAAAAAIRAGMTCDIDVPVTNGVIMFPSLGQVVVPVPTHGATVHCSSDGTEVAGDGFVVTIPDNPHQDAPHWQGLRALEAEAGGMPLRVLVDDLDPYRMPGTSNVGSRLAPSEAELWRSTLTEAWDLLVSRHALVAEEVATAITVLTPLGAPPRGVSSATSRETFGSVALSTPPDGTSLAVTLTHEVQHAKLSALLDIVALTMPDDGSRHYAPWRPDPRPLAGLLQGSYAYLGVTDFWRRQRQYEQGDTAIQADAEFARWREAARLVAGTLLGSGRLTGPGRSFVTRMAERLDSWAHEAVPPEARTLAREAADRHLALWRERNGERQQEPSSER